MAEKKTTKKKEVAAPAAAAKPAAAKKAPAKTALKKAAASAPAKAAAKKAPAKKAPTGAATKTKPAAAAAPPPRRPLGPVEEMEHFLEHLWRRPLLAPPAWLGRLKLPDLLGEISPSIDIFEDGNNVVVKAEVPGMKRDDLDVILTEDTISISGHKKSEEKVQRHDFHRVERSFGTFTRRLRLPAAVLPDKAKATFKDGVLEIIIPKAETGRATAVRKVTVG
jgi:HSP20 family protein